MVTLFLYFTFYPFLIRKYIKFRVLLLSVTCSEGGMPDEGDSVVEHVGGVQSRLAGVHYSRPIVGLCEVYLHKLGDVQCEGDCGDGDDVDQESLGVGHRLGYDPEH